MEFEQCKGMIYKEVLHRWNAMRRSRRDVTFDDLLSEGYYIYAWCLKNFDDSKGAKFTTYLYVQLKGKLSDYYNFERKPMQLYEDMHPDNDPNSQYEPTILSKNYNIDQERVEIYKEAEDELSYEANQVVKYILGREWETKMRRNRPTNAQIAKKFGYPEEVVESIMGEIKSFWKRREVA